MREKPSRRHSRKQYNNLIPLEAKTPNQKEYIKNIVENDVIFCSGPSGSGKSFVASGIAAHHLHAGDIEKIIITRPLVCSGKDVGSLPGELFEKIAPYQGPMQENLKYFLTQTFYGLYMNRGQICYAPLETMRGATFNNSYMLLDEAQNCTFEQIKMFITRMGQNSKVLINGDVDQTDLKYNSGLQECMHRLSAVNNVGICKLTYDDIQRHGLLGDILRALED
jgi:phosphate starvation-inducible PhoH-like protein